MVGGCSASTYYNIGEDIFSMSIKATNTQEMALQFLALIDELDVCERTLKVACDTCQRKLPDGRFDRVLSDLRQHGTFVAVTIDEVYIQSFIDFVYSVSVNCLWDREGRYTVTIDAVTHRYQLDVDTKSLQLLCRNDLGRYTLCTLVLLCLDDYSRRTTGHAIYWHIFGEGHISSLLDDDSLYGDHAVTLLARALLCARIGG